MKKICALLLTIVIVLTSSMAFAATEVDTNALILDTFAMRPFGLVSLVLGSAIYAVSLPIAAMTHSHRITYEKLVKDPFEFTFVRPMGEVGSLQ